MLNCHFHDWLLAVGDVPKASKETFGDGLNSVFAEHFSCPDRVIA